MPSPLHGQVSVGATPQPLSTAPIVAVAYTIKASGLNSFPVFVGNAQVTTANGFILNPGDSVDYELNSSNGANAFPLNVSDYWVVGTTGDKVSWLASPRVS